MSEYDVVQKSSLKLKGVAEKSSTINLNKQTKKKKKKKDKVKEDKAVKERAKVVAESLVQSSSGSADYYSRKTKAEIAFLKKKEKLDAARIRQKADESHKDRVEKFNSYLNNLTEHFEQAKVSWTK